MARKRYRRIFKFVVAELAALVGLAKTGEITGVFVVYRMADGSYDYTMECEDNDDIILEVRTSVIRAIQHNTCPEPETLQ